MGEFTEADRVIVDTLYNKMKKDADVHQAAQTDDRQIYERSLFPTIFDDTAMASYEENMEHINSYSLMQRNIMPFSRPCRSAI
mgnify:CR=1 FL=1